MLLQQEICQCQNVPTWKFKHNLLSLANCQKIFASFWLDEKWSCLKANIKFFRYWEENWKTSYKELAKNVAISIFSSTCSMKTGTPQKCHKICSRSDFSVLVSPTANKLFLILLYQSFFNWNACFSKRMSKLEQNKDNRRTRECNRIEKFQFFIYVKRVLQIMLPG